MVLRNFLNFYACPDVPNQIAAVSSNPRDPGARKRVHWHQRSLSTESQAFQRSLSATFGTSRRDIAHGPGINNTNMILAKNFILFPDRNVSLQLRMESDNVFNHTQFSNRRRGTTACSTSEQLVRRNHLQLQHVKPSSRQDLLLSLTATNKHKRRLRAPLVFMQRDVV